MDTKNKIRAGTDWTKNSVRGIIGGKRIAPGTTAKIADIQNGLVYALLPNTGPLPADNGRDIENVTNYRTGDFVILIRDAINFLPDGGTRKKFFSGDRAFVGYDLTTTNTKPTSLQWNKLKVTDVNKNTGELELIKIYFNANSYIGVPESFLASVNGNERITKSRQLRLDNINKNDQYVTLPIPEDNFLDFFKEKK